MVDKNMLTAVNMLIKTNRMHKKLIDSNVCRSIGLHRTLHMILMHLSRKDKLPSQKELAEHMNITPAAVTGALKKLESGGYIKRSIGDDNRYNEITITPLGRSIVEQTHEMFTKIDESLFYGFSDEEISGLIGYLEKIQNNISRNMEVET